MAKAYNFVVASLTPALKLGLLEVLLLLGFSPDIVIFKLLYAKHT
jgi:hypothetical protein